MARALDRLLMLAPVRTRLHRATHDPRMAALHALANRAAFRNAPWPVRILARLADEIAWPIVCAVLCLRADEKLDRAVEATGLSRAAYLRRQWAACVRLKIPPREYLHFAFHQPGRLARAGDHVFDIENWRLVGWLNEGADIRPLQDKLAFAQLCEAAGLPTPPVLAVVSGGRPTVLRPADDAAWRGPLFAKPRSAKAGAGMRRYAFEDGAWIDAAGQRRDLAGVLAELSAMSAGGDYVVVPAIANDAGTAAFAPGALSTARVMTGRFPDGRTVAVGAFFRMGRGGSLVDNISAGGLMATVDLSTGVLSPANRRWDPYRLIEAHPDTGAVFAGKRLFQWEAILALALKGHGMLPGFAFVSWDIAPTPDGPVIVEANHHGGTVAFQEINGAPLSETPFPDVVLARLSGRQATGMSANGGWRTRDDSNV